jgi:hypothetical protein
VQIQKAETLKKEMSKIPEKPLPEEELNEPIFSIGNPNAFKD